MCLHETATEERDVEDLGNDCDRHDREHPEKVSKSLKWLGWYRKINFRSHLTSKCVQWQAWLGPGNKTPTNRNIKMSFIQVKV